MAYNQTTRYQIEDLAGEGSVVEKKLLNDKNNNSISTCLVTPKNSVSDSVVIIPPGLGAIKENSSKVVLIPEFIKHNISTIIFDNYGHGESSGKIFDITPTKMINALEIVIDYAQKKGFKNIVLYTSSSPALASIVAVVKFSTAIKLFILQSPILDFKNFMITTRGKDGFDKWQERGYFIHPGHIGRRRIGFGYYIDSEKYNVCKDYLPKIACKTLLIAAGKDRYVGALEIEKIKSALKNKDYHLIENADHLYSGKDTRKQLNKLIVDFVTKNIPN